MNEKPIILNAEPENYCEEGRAILRGFSMLVEKACTRAELMKMAGDCDALIVRLGHKVDEELLAKCSRLKAVVTATTGLNHIDLEAAEKLGIAVLSLRGEREFLDTITATAEHTWGLLLALVRHIPAAHRSVIEGRWDRDSFRGIDLSGRRLGIVGLGRLGTMIARYGKAFGMEVIATDPEPVSSSGDVKLVDLDTLFRESDVVTVHVSLTKETAGLVGEHELSLMKKDAVLINTSRGEIVDEAAIVAALENKSIAGAALDVLQGEASGNPAWLSQSPAIKYAASSDNLLLTPHIGGATSDSMKKTEIFMAEKLKKFFGG